MTFLDTARRDVQELTRRNSELEARREDLRYRHLSDELELAKIAQRFDPTYKAVGAGQAPSPLPRESTITYRSRLMSQLQPLSNHFTNADFYKINESTLDVVEPQLLADVHNFTTDKTRPNEDGSLREIKRESAGGHAVTEFAGEPIRWMAAYMSPGRTVRKLSRSPGGPPLFPNRQYIPNGA
jgi:hypothetical protein